LVLTDRKKLWGKKKRKKKEIMKTKSNTNSGCNSRDGVEAKYNMLRLL
jgi:hypothetical protein